MTGGAGATVGVPPSGQVQATKYEKRLSLRPSEKNAKQTHNGGQQQQGLYSADPSPSAENFVNEIHDLFASASEGEILDDSFQDKNCKCNDKLINKGMKQRR